MALPPVLNSIITWLRAGYPEGVPDVDYLPLFALLGSELTDADVKAIVTELESTSSPETAQHIKDVITSVNGDSKPSDADVARVRARLAGGGWPLAKPQNHKPAHRRSCVPGRHPLPAQNFPTGWAMMLT
jgi:hypothetical protein